MYATHETCHEQHMKAILVICKTLLLLMQHVKHTM
jgi:hypothetical protein